MGHYLRRVPSIHWLRYSYVHPVWTQHVVVPTVPGSYVDRHTSRSSTRRCKVDYDIARICEECMTSRDEHNPMVPVTDWCDGCPLQRSSD